MCLDIDIKLFFCNSGKEPTPYIRPCDARVAITAVTQYQCIQYTTFLSKYAFSLERIDCDTLVCFGQDYSP